MFQVVSAILIVACPCALALSTPFTMGHIMRILGRNKMYVKDAHTIEKWQKLTLWFSIKLEQLLITKSQHQF